MSIKAIRGAFNESMNQIDYSIKEAYNNKFDEIVLNNQDSDPQNKLKKEVEVIEQKISSLQKELAERNDSLAQLDPSVVIDAETNGVLASAFKHAGYRTQRSRIDAAKEIVSTKERRNYSERKKIQKGYKYTFSLASSAKEMRQVMFKLQSINWKDLGINVPDTFIADLDVQIKNGQIKTKALGN